MVTESVSRTRVHPVTYQAKLEELVFSLRPHLVFYCPQAVLSMHKRSFLPFSNVFSNAA